MPEDPYGSLLELAKMAAVEAGNAIMQVYDNGDYTSEHKSDDYPVTSADYLANDIINERLRQHTPNIPIMSEENQQTALKERQVWERYWLIDPIDGTQEFIARSGDFAVNIALIEHNQPVIGVIYWPAGQTLYFAAKHRGAFKTSPLGEERIRVRQLDDPHSSAIIVAISRRQARERVMSKLSATRVYHTLPLGSCSLKACFIAEGKADVFLRIGKTGEWDTGASECIINEAGGCISSASFEALTYNRRDSLDNPDFIVMGDPRVPWRQLLYIQ